MKVTPKELQLMAAVERAARTIGSAVPFTADHDVQQLKKALGELDEFRTNPKVERRYWETDHRYYDCFCPGCGAYMKGRDAGVDEGTDDEWCGSCR